MVVGSSVVGSKIGVTVSNMATKTFASSNIEEDFFPLWQRTTQWSNSYKPTIERIDE